MKKFIPLVVVLALVIIGGVYFFGKKTAMAPAINDSNIVSDSVKQEKTTLVSSIKDAMALGQTMQCTYAVNENNPAVTATAYINGSKFKMETVASGANMTVLSDGEKQYVWNNGTKQGFSITKTCMKELEATLPRNDGNEEPRSNSGDLAATLDAAKNVQCEPASGIDFAVPKDVTFADQCAMMRQTTQTFRERGSKFPTGVNIPSY